MKFLTMAWSKFALILMIHSIATEACDNVTCQFQLELENYSCKVLNFSFGSANVIIGDHEPQKNNSDVQVLWIPKDSPISSLPVNICSQFTSLKKFKIETKELKEISRRAFSGCSSVDEILIIGTSLSWLSEDLFNDLINIKSIHMINNQILILPKNLFSENQKLEEIDFSQNRLVIIETTLPSSLKSISFKNNLCVDKSFPGDYSSIDQMVLNLHETCNVTNILDEKSSLKSRIIDLERGLCNDNSCTSKDADEELSKTQDALQKAEKKVKKLEALVSDLGDKPDHSPRETQETRTSRDSNADVTLSVILIIAIFFGWFISIVIYVWKQHCVKFAHRRKSRKTNVISLNRSIVRFTVENVDEDI